MKDSFSMLSRTFFFCKFSFSFLTQSLFSQDKEETHCRKIRKCKKPDKKNPPCSIAFPIKDSHILTTFPLSMVKIGSRLTIEESRAVVGGPVGE